MSLGKAVWASGLSLVEWAHWGYHASGTLDDMASGCNAKGPREVLSVQTAILGGRCPCAFTLIVFTSSTMGTGTSSLSSLSHFRECSHQGQAHIVAFCILQHWTQSSAQMKFPGNWRYEQAYASDEKNHWSPGSRTTPFTVFTQNPANLG